MQGNDLESGVASRNAVLMIPTLFIPPPKKRWGVKAKVGEFTIVLPMLSWMLHHAYQSNEAFEVWLFESDPFTEELSQTVEDYASRATSNYAVFQTEQAAQFALVNDRGIKTVYDADHARNDRLWGLRGYRVPVGSHP